MLGCWVRPWRGETLCGTVVAVSGDYLICRAPGGFEFRIRIADFEAGKVERYASDPTATRGPSRAYRLTGKGMDATTGKLFALPAVMP